MEENLTIQTTKNVGWNFATKLITKIGGLVFTILIARMLAPELFGVYTLVLSLFIIFLGLTDLGISNTSVRYLSYCIGEKKIKKARSYFKYLLKIKILLLLTFIFFLIILSKFLAYNIFDKPVILFPLLFSSLYLVADSFYNFFNSIFTAKKEIPKIFFLEIISETSKIVFALVAIYILSEKFIVSGVFVALALASFSAFLANLILLKKDKNIIFGEIENFDKKRVYSYLKSMSLVSLSLVFFGSIDTLMLGRFVDVQFIGFYRVAFSLVTTIATFFALGNILLPIFTQISGDRFERGFEKVVRYILTITIPAMIGIILIARYLILVIYGTEYLTAAFPLYILAPIIIISPLIMMYSSIFQAQEKTNILSKAVIISLILNIILNYSLIKYFLVFSQEYAIMGAGLATVISRGFYLIFLSNKSRMLFKTKIPWDSVIKSTISALFMAGFLFLFNYFIDINIYWGIIEIILGIIIYFTIMFVIKGIVKEDLDLIKKIILK